METLDDTIAELIYAENLPDEFAESPHFHKLMRLMRSAPAIYEPPTRRAVTTSCDGLMAA